MSQQRLKVLLFDIGGVCVTSPFHAILDYETAHNIPHGWINHAISASGPRGAWARIERGEIPLDSTFFSAFSQDLSSKALWEKFWDKKQKDGKGQVVGKCPEPPCVDGEALYWDMMRVSRTPDKDMWPALQKLRKIADGRDDIIVAALSNTTIFPPGHPYNDPSDPSAKFHNELKATFDLFVSSAHVGMRKPDPDIYLHTVGQLDKLAKERGWKDGVKAEDIVFFDDIGTNLRTAKGVGMRTVKVGLGKGDKAVEELERLTGLSLKDPSPKL